MISRLRMRHWVGVFLGTALLATQAGAQDFQKRDTVEVQTPPQEPVRSRPAPPPEPTRNDEEIKRRVEKLKAEQAQRLAEIDRISQELKKLQTGDGQPANLPRADKQPLEQPDRNLASEIKVLTELLRNLSAGKQKIKEEQARIEAQIENLSAGKLKMKEEQTRMEAQIQKVTQEIERIKQRRSGLRIETVPFSVPLKPGVGPNPPVAILPRDMPVEQFRDLVREVIKSWPLDELRERRQETLKQNPGLQDIKRMLADQMDNLRKEQKEQMERQRNEFERMRRDQQRELDKLRAEFLQKKKEPKKEEPRYPGEKAIGSGGVTPPPVAKTPSDPPPSVPAPPTPIKPPTPVDPSRPS